MVFSGECVRVDGRIKLDFHRQLCFSLAFQSDCIDEKLEEYEVGGTYSCVGVEAAGRVGVSVLSLKLVVGGISSSIILTCLIRVALGELYPDQLNDPFPLDAEFFKKVVELKGYACLPGITEPRIRTSPTTHPHPTHSWWTEASRTTRSTSTPT